VSIIYTYLFSSETILLQVKNSGTFNRKIMSRLVKLASFDSLIEIKFNLLKDMLDEAGIAYLTNNENSRAVKPALSMMPSMMPSIFWFTTRIWKKR
jgi:hypothetical protein